MELNNLVLSISLVLFGGFFYKYFSLIIKKFNPDLLVDNQFKKPQAFHSYPVPTLGGLCIFFSLLIVFLDFLIFKKVFLLEYISFCLFFFILGFLDDLKINIAPKVRLLIMIFFLLLLVKYNNFYLEKAGIDFLNYWLKSSEIFSLIFVSLCFLFIVNGANLIDGYNGLLGIHSLIILLNLFFINYFNYNTSLSTLLFYSILILIVFLIFNFPKAKIFLGDSGSYLLGSFIAVSIIKTSIENPTISPFYFCIILFYLFFEVFFSFFRKLIKEKKSPIHPDEKHLHMLLYKILIKKNNDKQRSNYLTSVIINLIYLILIIPAVLMKDNGIFCKYYSILFFIFYIFSYKMVYKKN